MLINFESCGILIFEKYVINDRFKIIQNERMINIFINKDQDENQVVIGKFISYLFVSKNESRFFKMTFLF